MLWIMWMGGFFAIEIPAILNNKRDDTLSEHFRIWFHIKSKRGLLVWIFVFGPAAIWFAIHIASPGKI